MVPFVMSGHLPEVAHPASLSGVLPDAIARAYLEVSARACANQLSIPSPYCTPRTSYKAFDKTQTFLSPLAGHPRPATARHWAGPAFRASGGDSARAARRAPLWHMHLHLHLHRTQPPDQQLYSPAGSRKQNIPKSNKGRAHIRPGNVRRPEILSRAPGTRYGSTQTHSVISAGSANPARRAIVSPTRRSQNE